MTDSNRSEWDTVESILAVLFKASSDQGVDAACELATAHLVAATSFLEKSRGGAHTKRVLVAAIQAIDPSVQPGIT